MPVRIIFRGLILFRIENRKTEGGRIIADLIDPPHAAASAAPTESTEAAGSASRAASHIHRHQPEYQAYTGKKNEPEMLQLKPGRNVDIKIIGSEEFVDTDLSYDHHCPKLSQILDEADDPEFHGQPWREHDPDFVRTRVIVNRGIIRVKEVVSWDAGAFPLTQNREEGLTTSSPALVRFRGSAVKGHMASECVIDVEDSHEVHIIDSASPNLHHESDDASRASHEPHSTDSLSTDSPAGNEHGEHASPGLGEGSRRRILVGEAVGTPRVPPKTVEILFTNFSAQQAIAVPWSLHFPWLFKAASYTPRPVPPKQLEEFEESARNYFRLNGMSDTQIDEAIQRELDLLEPGRLGFPFPYLEPEDSLTRLERIPEPKPKPMPIMADPWNLPLCPQGDNSKKLGGS